MPPKRKLPVWVTKSLECPVCLATIKDPPIFQCEKGHGLCQTCREPLKAENKPCSVCRGRLTDTRNLAVENMLEQLPKIKCKYEGCTFQRSNGELVKRHEDEECRERPVRCEFCQEPRLVHSQSLFVLAFFFEGKFPLSLTNHQVSTEQKTRC